MDEQLELLKQQLADWKKQYESNKTDDLAYAIKEAEEKLNINTSKESKKKKAKKDESENLHRDLV